MKSLDIPKYNLVKDVLGSNRDIKSFKINQSTALTNTHQSKRNIQSARTHHQGPAVNQSRNNITQRLQNVNFDEVQNFQAKTFTASKTSNNFLKNLHIDSSDNQNVFFNKKKYFADVQVINSEGENTKLTQSNTDHKMDNSKANVKNNEFSKLSNDILTNNSNKIDKKVCSMSCRSNLNERISILDLGSKPRALMSTLTTEKTPRDEMFIYKKQRNDSPDIFIDIEDGISEQKNFTEDFLESVDNYLYHPEFQKYSSYKQGTDATDSYKNFVYRSDISKKIREIKSKPQNCYTLNVKELTADGKVIAENAAKKISKKPMSLVHKHNKMIMQTNEEIQRKRKDTAFLHRKFASNPDRDRFDLFTCNNYVSECMTRKLNDRIQLFGRQSKENTMTRKKNKVINNRFLREEFRNVNQFEHDLYTEVDFQAIQGMTEEDLMKSHNKKNLPLKKKELNRLKTLKYENLSRNVTGSKILCQKKDLDVNTHVITGVDLLDKHGLADNDKLEQLQDKVKRKRIIEMYSDSKSQLPKTRFEKIEKYEGNHNMEFYEFLNSEVDFEEKPRSQPTKLDDIQREYKEKGGLTKTRVGDFSVTDRPKKRDNHLLDNTDEFVERTLKFDKLEKRYVSKFHEKILGVEFALAFETLKTKAALADLRGVMYGYDYSLNLEPKQRFRVIVMKLMNNMRNMHMKHDDVLIKNHYPVRPFHKKNAAKQFKTVRDGELKKVYAILDKDPFLVYCFDFVGQTALHVAIRRHQYKIISYQIFRKSNMEAMDNKGKRPLMYAIEENDRTAVNLLLSAGCFAYGAMKYNIMRYVQCEDIREDIIKRRKLEVIVELSDKYRKQFLRIGQTFPYRIWYPSNFYDIEQLN